PSRVRWQEPRLDVRDDQARQQPPEVAGSDSAVQGRVPSRGAPLAFGRSVSGSATVSTAGADFVAALRGRIPEERLERDVPLAPYTTSRIGGPADLLYRARTEDELAHAVTAARE